MVVLNKQRTLTQQSQWLKGGCVETKLEENETVAVNQLMWGVCHKVCSFYWHNNNILNNQASYRFSMMEKKDKNMSREKKGSSFHN